MFTSNLFNRFQLLSISLVLCTSSPALAQVKPLETFNNNSQPDTQIATNQLPSVKPKTTRKEIKQAYQASKLVLISR